MFKPILSVEDLPKVGERLPDNVITRAIGASPFDTAEYYDCTDSEEYTHGTVDECLEAYFDGWATPGESIQECIAKHSPVTVEAYDRDAVTAEWVGHVIENVIDRIREDFAEDYGSPSGEFPGHDDPVGEPQKLVVKTAILQVIKPWQVWRCEKVAECTYSAEEVEKILRDYCPEWFEEKRDTRE